MQLTSPLYRHTDDGTAMTLEDLETFSGLQIPAPDGVIGSSAQQDFTGSVDRHARDGAGVSLERPQRLGRVERPRDGGGVGRTGDQQVAAVLRVLRFLAVVVVGRRYENQRVDAATMPAKLAHRLSADEVPTARGAVVGAAEDEVAGTDDAVDGGFVAFQNRRASARRHVPLADCLVRAAA